MITTDQIRQLRAQCRGAGIVEQREDLAALTGISYRTLASYESEREGVAALDATDAARLTLLWLLAERPELLALIRARKSATVAL